MVRSLKDRSMKRDKLDGGLQCIRPASKVEIFRHERPVDILSDLAIDRHFGSHMNFLKHRGRGHLMKRCAIRHGGVLKQNDRIRVHYYIEYI